MDPALSELLRAGEAENRMVEAIIRFRRRRVDVAGVRLIARFGDIATCRLALADVRRVREHPDVLSLKASRTLGPEAVLSARDSADARAPEPRRTDARRPPGLPLTGAGVVVGAVDWGMDPDYDGFKASDGTTRLLALWDQRSGSPGRSPRPYGYGTVHARSEIDRALISGEPYRSLRYHPAASDRGGGTHGAHVLDIAAGNGRAGGPEGVAPGADLVFVHLADRGTGGLANLGDSVRLLEAVDFIRRTAGRRPWVINLSVGRHGGPHDGSTLIELAFDALLRAAPGRFIVQSTGNYFRARTHACGVLRPGETRTLTFVTDPADTSPNELEIWYDGADEFLVRVDPPGQDRARTVSLGGEAGLIGGDQLLGRIYHRARDPNNRDNHLDAFLFPVGRAGEWKVTIEARRVSSGRFHAWLERDEACPGCQARFTAGDSEPAYSTGTLANGRVPLVVGAFDGHVNARPAAPFSSAGPTRDHRAKPDLAAPGVDILAARSAGRGADRSPGLQVRKSGTSMATPHVTGAVALCLEAAGHRLDAQGIRALVLAAARPPDPSRDDGRLGRGYLDLPQMVAAALAAFPNPRSLPDTKDVPMDADLDITMPLALAPATAYRELLYAPGRRLPQVIGERFELVGRPGERVSEPPRAGDVLLRVTLGRRGGGSCAVLAGSALSRRRTNDGGGPAGWYAAARDARAEAGPLPLRVLDPSGCVPAGQLLLRPREPEDEEGTEPPHVRAAKAVWDTHFRRAAPAFEKVEIRDLATAPSRLVRCSDFNAWTQSPTRIYVRDDPDATDISWRVVLHHEALHIRQFRDAGGKPPRDHATMMKFECDAYRGGAAWAAGHKLEAVRDFAGQLQARADQMCGKVAEVERQTSDARTRNARYREFLLAESLLPPHKDVAELYAASSGTCDPPAGEAAEAGDAEASPDKAKETIRAQAGHWGTDEAAVMSALRGLLPSQMAELSADGAVVDILVSELSGAELAAAAAQLARGRVGSMGRADVDRILAAPVRHGFGTLAAATARDVLLGHHEAFDRTGTGTIHGSQCGAPKPAGTTTSDCTEYVKDVLRRAFAAAGRSSLWTDVLAEATRRSGAAGLKGTEVMKALQSKQRWEALFWAPDPADPADGQSEHPYAHRIVRTKGTYYGITVDRAKSVVGYRRTNPANSSDLSGIERLRRLQFGLLAARGGTHMAMVVNGAVYEVHWASPATDRDAVQATPLERFPWLSGAIAAPPGDLGLAWRTP